MTTKKSLCVGSECSTFIRFLHPAAKVSDTITNRTHNARLDKLLAMRLERFQVNRCEQECVVFQHDKFPNLEIHAVKCWVCVDVEGHGVKLTGIEDVGEGNEEEEEPGQEIPAFVRNAQADDIAFIHNAGFAVNDDNEPEKRKCPH